MEGGLGMGSPRHVDNRQWRTRKGPEPACVQAPFHVGVAHEKGEKDELTSCRGTVQSAEKCSPRVCHLESWMGEPVRSPKNTPKDEDADENVDADHVRTGRPVENEQSVDLVHTSRGHKFDFRVSGLPHAVVNRAKNFRVRELVKNIENHPHRQDLQADLQQNNAYNPFSEESKVKIREMGNVELFELCEKFPKVQCTECLLYWNQGIVYCTCGHLLNEREASQDFHQ